MANDSGPKYLVRDAQGNVYGPADAATLRDWVGQGRIVAGMHIAAGENGEWVEVSTHPALADVFAGLGAGSAGAMTAGGAGPGVTGPGVPVTPVGQAGPEPALLSYATDRPRTNPLGLYSMIAGALGLLGLPMTCIPLCGCMAGPVAGLLALTAIVLGSIGLYQVHHAPLRYTGRGMAITGLSLGIGIIILYVVILVVAIVMGMRHP